MANRFLSNVNINDEYTLPSADGTADQIITTDGAGQLSFVDQSTINAGNAEHVVIYAKNTSGASISKGTPVYITGTVGATDTVEIAPADAGNSAKMPAVGLLDDTLAVNDFGYVITGGFMDNITTDPIDGVTPSSNDTVYVKAGGGLTLTKPTGSNLIQNVAKVGKVSGGNSGSLIVSSILRTNDVPNLTTGKIWVGTANNTAESTVVHLDETNRYMGIGTTSPAHKLDVVGNVKISSGGLAIENTSSHAYVALPGGAFYHSTLGSETGAIKITLPTHGTGDMLSFVVDIFDYTINESFTVNIKGYLYQTTGNNEWVNVSAQTIASNINRNFTVRFGADGSNNCVWIGETNSSWSYPQIQVRDFTAGFSADVDSYIDGWDVDIVTSFDTVDETYFSPFPMSKEVYGSGIHLRGSGSSYFNGGNVGIGTTNPQRKFHVNGIARIEANGQTLDLVGTDHSYIGFYPDGVSAGRKAYIGFPGSTINRLTISNEFDDDISFFTNGSEKVTIENSGNVGIGTTSPSEKLDVAGDATFDGRIYTNATALASVGILGKAIANGWAARYDSNNANYSGFFFDANNDASMYLRDDAGNTNVLVRSDSSSYFNGGNFGIGTTGPSAKLDVASGDIRLATNATYFRVRDTAGNQPRVLGMNASNNFYVGPIDTYAGGPMLYGISANVNKHGFNIGGGEKVTINASGNLGIGTTSPSYKLDVDGEARFGDNGGILLTDDSGTSYVRALNNHLNLRTTRDADDIYFSTGTTPTTKMFIQGDTGNVGIGTTGPSEKLHVYNGTAYVTPISYAANQSAYALKTGAYNNTAFDMGLQIKSTSGGSPYMSFRTNSVDDVLTMWGGSVGVGGIGIPSYTLDVNGVIRGEQYLRLTDTAGTNQFSIRAESTYGTLDNGSKTFNYIASNHLFLVGASEKMRINSSGNVGIGTTSPGAKLDIFNTGGSAGSLADCQTYSALTVKPYSSVDSKLTFSANGVSTQLIQATNNAGTTGRQISLQPFSGNVGIGVTLPSEKLDVNGSIKASASTDAYKGYIKSVITTGYSMKTAITAYQYIPYNSYTLTTLQTYYNRTVAAYNGRVKKIIVKRIDGASADATGMKFKKEVNGTVNATEYTATVLSGSGNFQATYNFAQTDFTFSAGDSIGVLMQSSGGTGMIGAGAIQIVLEYNIT